MTATTKPANYEGVNADYGVPLEGEGLSFPAIQANIYQPKNKQETISLGLSEESLDKLDPSSGVGELCKPELCNFRGKDATIWILPEGIRYVILGIPRVFIFNKETETFRPPINGEQLAGTPNITATRVPMAMLKPSGDMVLDDCGLPQIFTMKLTSNRTKLLTGDKRNPDLKSIRQLNKALQGHFKKPGMSLTHLVSVKIGTEIRLQESVVDRKNSSLGIMFTLEGNAKQLPETQQAATFELLKGKTIRELLADPFGINPKPAQQEQEDPDHYHDAKCLDEVPF